MPSRARSSEFCFSRSLWYVGTMTEMLPVPDELIGIEFRVFDLGSWRPRFVGLAALRQQLEFSFVHKIPFLSALLCRKSRRFEAARGCLPPLATTRSLKCLMARCVSAEACWTVIVLAAAVRRQVPAPRLEGDG